MYVKYLTLVKTSEGNCSPLFLLKYAGESNIRPLSRLAAGGEHFGDPLLYVVHGTRERLYADTAANSHC